MSSSPSPETISARLYLYRVFQRLFGDEPTEEMFSAIDQDLLREACDVLGIANTEMVDAFCAALDSAAREQEQTHLDYMHLFVGPAQLLVPPWESVYRDKQRLLMTQTTLDVRQAYRKSGYAVQADSNVPDDHIATELDFLARLAQESLEALEADNEPAHHAAADAEARFLNDHFRVWVGDFASALSESAPGSLYDHAAELLVALVEPKSTR